MGNCQQSRKKKELKPNSVTSLLEMHPPTSGAVTRAASVEEKDERPGFQGFFLLPEPHRAQEKCKKLKRMQA